MQFHLKSKCLYMRSEFPFCISHCLQRIYLNIIWAGKAEVLLRCVRRKLWSLRNKTRTTAPNTIITTKLAWLKFVDPTWTVYNR